MKKNKNASSFGAGLVEVDYQAYLAQHDVVYLSPANGGYNGMPIGNGDLGAMVWTESDKLVWAVNKCDLFDDSPATNFGCWDSDWEEKVTCLRSACRLTISNSLPSFDQTYLADYEQRLDLHKAEVDLRSQTPFSKVQTESFVDAATKCLVIRYHDETEEQSPRTISLSRWGSRVFAHWYVKILRDPTIGLKGTETQADGRTAVIMQETRSLRFAVACRISADESATWERLHSRELQCRLDPDRDSRITIYLSVVNSEEDEDPVQKAVENVRKAEAVGFDRIRQQHHDRWHEFWSRSFIDIPDKYAENLWYLNLYILGSSATGRYPPNNNSGIWTWNHDYRAWNHYFHWNNDYLTWPVYAAGHPELARSYLEMAFAGLPNAKADARKYHDSSGALYADVCDRRGYQDPGSEDSLGYSQAFYNLTVGAMLALDCWRYYRYTADETFLQNRAYPIMSAACQLYLDLLRIEDDGLYHLPGSHPYEHPGQYLVRDCITDLAAIKASFPVTAQVASEYGNHEFAAKLKEVVDNLVDFEIIDLPACYVNNNTEKPTYSHGLMNLAIDDPRMICAGRRTSDNVAVYTQEDATIGRVGLFPQTQDAPICPFGVIGLKDRSTELFSVARTTVEANWGTQMGMSICLCPISFARLGMGEQAMQAVQMMITSFQQFRQGFGTDYPVKPVPVKELGDAFKKKYTGDESTKSSVFDQHGPRSPLGIDMTRDCVSVDRRNFIEVINSNDEWIWFPSIPLTHFMQTGGCAIQTGINEMLLQSHEEVIRIAPAVPPQFDGTFVLLAQGGFEVTARIEDGAVRFAAIKAQRDGTCCLDNPWHDRAGSVNIIPHDKAGGKKMRLDGAEVSFSARTGQEYLILPDSESEPIDVVRPPCEPKRKKPRHGHGRLIGIEKEF